MDRRNRWIKSTSKPARPASLDLAPPAHSRAEKLNNHDEGGIRIAIGIKDGVVMIDFGSEVTWLGLPKAEAIAFAEADFACPTASVRRNALAM